MHKELHVSSPGYQVLEIKRATAAAAALRSEVAKYKEQVDECTRLKAFLDSVTPSEWFAEQRAIQDAARAARMDAWQVQFPLLFSFKEKGFTRTRPCRRRYVLICCPLCSVYCFKECVSCLTLSIEPPLIVYMSKSGLLHYYAWEQLKM